MSNLPDNSNRWIDGELRRVPLPEGLLARLRALAEKGSDADLDAQICDVAVPDDLITRLWAIPDEETVDRRLAEVEVPDGLMARLYQIPDDEALDERIRDVPTPAALVPQVTANVGRTRRRMEFARMATAASVFIAVGLSAYAGRDWISLWFGNGPAIARPTAASGDENLPALPTDPISNVADSSKSDGHSDSKPSPIDNQGVGDVASQDTARARDLAKQVASGVADRLSAWWREGAPDATVKSPDLRNIFTANPILDDAPPLDTVDRLAPRGLTPPRVAGFDRFALARSGVNPFVNPSANASLEATAVPLVTSSVSYDDLWQRLGGEASGVLTAASVRVRPEDFLAAMNYNFAPPSSGALAIRTSAGPSPFGSIQSTSTDVRLLQIGVQAASIDRVARPPVDVTFAVDVSRSMGVAGRLAMVRDALADSLRRLQPRDRVTLIAFGDKAEVLVDRAASSDSALWRRAVERITIQRATGFGAGLDLASRTAHRPAAQGARRQLVVFADAPAVSLEQDRLAIRKMLAAVRRDGVDVAFVDLTLGSEEDRELADFARAASGSLHQVESAADIRAVIVETLTGRSAIVAQDAQLTLRFNPRAVASYRLVGHEATIGLPMAPLKVSFRSGEAATALFEVILTPSGANDVGEAELVWTDPATGKSQRVTQPISRVQFANSLAESSVSLQAAAFAAETAEVLRSQRTGVNPSTAPAAATGHSLDRVLEAARAVHPRLAEQAEFQRLLRLIEQAKQAGLVRAIR